MRRILKLVLGLVVLMLLSFVVTSLWLRPAGVPEQSILRIVLDGKIPENQPPELAAFFAPAPVHSMQRISNAIRGAASDPRIQGLVLEIRQPQIGMGQIQELEDAMAVFRRSQKWNVSFFETAGELSPGTGVYGAAITAATVTMSPPGELNLVSVRAQVPFFKGLLRKFDVQVHVDKRHKYKTAANALTHDRLNREHRETLKSLLTDLQNTVVTHISKRRRTTPDIVTKWFKAPPFTSEQAKNDTLVDELWYWSDVERHAEDVAGRPNPIVDLGIYHPAPDPNLDPANRVALIVGEGEVVRGAGGGGPMDGSGAMGSDTVTAALRDARRAGVKAIVFRVNSPGGSYIASDLIRQEVQEARTANIPVVVSMGDVAASGGYFVSLGANHVLAHPGTITGSIGAFAGSFALRRAIKRYTNVTFDKYITQPDTTTLNWLDLPDRRGRQLMGKFLDRVYDDFVAKTAAARKKSKDEIHKVAQGRVWTGSQALKHGLVDELGGMTMAFTRAKELARLGPEDPIDIVVFPRPKTLLEQFQQVMQSQQPASVLATAKALMGQLLQEAAAARTAHTVQLQHEIPAL